MSLDTTEWLAPHKPLFLTESPWIRQNDNGYTLPVAWNGTVAVTTSLLIQSLTCPVACVVAEPCLFCGCQNDALPIAPAYTSVPGSRLLEITGVVMSTLLPGPPDVPEKWFLAIFDERRLARLIFVSLCAMSENVDLYFIL